MAHVRTQIRNAIAASLDGLTTTASNVVASRIKPERDFPSLSVYTVDEDNEFETMGSPRGEKRDLEVIIEAHVEAVTGFDDQLDLICQEIEEQLAGDASLKIKNGGLLYDLYLSRTSIDLLKETATPTGIAKLQYFAEYRVYENDLSTVI